MERMTYEQYAEIYLLKDDETYWALDLKRVLMAAATYAVVSLIVFILFMEAIGAWCIPIVVIISNLIYFKIIEKNFERKRIKLNKDRIRKFEEKDTKRNGEMSEYLKRLKERGKTKTTSAIK